jgi:hypothetical protein
MAASGRTRRLAKKLQIIYTYISWEAGGRCLVAGLATSRGGLRARSNCGFLRSVDRKNPDFWALFEPAR